MPGFPVRDLDGPASAPEGTITWGHDDSFYRTLDSDALYTSNAGSAFQTEYYDATTNESLETSSVFTQTFAGTPVGMISGVETYHRTYAGGYSIAFLMYGGMQSWNYNGTDSWTWEDPGLSTFDPELLEEVPMRPLAAPQATPHSFAVPSATKTVWMPPAIIEDPDAAAAEEGEGVTIEGILWSLIPGSSLYDAYQNWKKGEYGSFVFNGLTGIVDVATMGAVSKVNGFVKSGFKGFTGVLKQTAKNTKNLLDDGLRLVRGNLDNAGKGLIDSPGKLRLAKYGHLWQKADLEKAIVRHAGPNATSWRTTTGKTIFENPATGRQVVVDDAGYFRIFQPKSFGSKQGQYLDLLGKVPAPARRVKGGTIKNVPLTDDELNSATHFLNW